MQNRGLPEKAAIISEGLRIGFRTNQRDLLLKVSSIFVPDRAPTYFADLNVIYSLAEFKQRLYRAYRGSRVLVRHANLKTALDFIETDVQYTIAKRSREHLFLHAGVIGWRGRAVLFPGRTCSGKSTLIRALIRAGAVYFSDEFARIDAQGRVHPFLRPLSFRTSRGKSILCPEQEDLKIASGPSPIGAIIATQYVTDGAWCPAPLSPGAAVLELLRNAVAVRLDPAKAVRCVGKLASSAYAISSPRGEAGTTVPLLLETLDRLFV